jgi:hypothetical protein
MTLKLGLIGSSEGNGHPFSWSAIFNGYDSAAMEMCGFPAIPRYLEKQSWPQDQAAGAAVTTVWTQSLELSRSIASAGKIPAVVENLEDMIGEVDGVLLARDDSGAHFQLAAPFLRAGLPVYIDKPIALSLRSLDGLYELETRPGQIFTCSALRHSQELTLSRRDKDNLGDLISIEAFAPKSWDKYAIHVVEPVLKLLPAGDRISSWSSSSIKPKASGEELRTLTVLWVGGVETRFTTTGMNDTPILIKLKGTKGTQDLVFTDTFSAFRAALQSFVNGIMGGTIESPRAFNEQVVDLLEKGRS